MRCVCHAICVCVPQRVAQMTKVTIDSRERTLLNIFRERGDGFEVRSLPCGDIEVEYENGRGWICERKTCVDLAGSLVDGRWKEQTSRLFSCGKKFVIITGGVSQHDYARRAHPSDVGRI